MNENKVTIESSLVHSFLLMTRMMNMNITYEEVIHKIGSKENIKEDDILYLAKDQYSLKTKSITLKQNKLHKQPFPSIVKLKDNKYTLIFSIEEDEYTIYDFETSQKIKLKAENFEKIYGGSLILIIKADDEESSTIKNFGLAWFIRSFFKQDKLINHILFAAFILQVFALITPLFTMIIIDKVFSSSGTSTLEVLIIGLFIISVFDFIIAYSRKHLLSHMTAVTDVIMVSKFFKHLTSLPLSFFTSRQTGDVVARFKEVEFIRNFVSSSFLVLSLTFDSRF